MATAWTAGEVEDLAERWRFGFGAITLPGSCPHCDHNGAFMKVRVPTTFANNLGDRYLRPVDGQPVPAAPPQVPPGWVVECRCDHADHGDDGGCGRSGWVAIPERA